jgi:hypothetical protein
MDYLLEDAVEFVDDFLADWRGQLGPDLGGRRGHGPYSFTRASSSRAASTVSWE